MGEGSLQTFKGIGTLRDDVMKDGVYQYIVAREVEFVPDLTTNSPSVSCLRRIGLCVPFYDDPADPDKKVVTISERICDKIIDKGFQREFGLYKMMLTSVRTSLYPESRAMVVCTTPG